MANTKAVSPAVTLADVESACSWTLGAATNNLRVKDQGGGYFSVTANHRMNKLNCDWSGFWVEDELNERLSKFGKVKITGTINYNSVDIWIIIK